jgi:transcriptional regulator GlxA family with amidase domain
MKTITILVPQNAVPAAIVDPQYLFTAVNGFFSQAGHQPFFKVQLVGVQKEIQLSNGMLTIRPELLLEEVEHTDLIIVPAIAGSMDEGIAANEELFSWISSQYAKGAEVASLCVGAFLLASTGLLNGKSCSTHWLFVQEFKERFPEVIVMPDRVITEQNGIYSSGGASSYWNLLLYLVEKYTSREMAIMASKFFLLDIEKNSQLPFSIFQGQKQHGDELILALQKYIEGKYQERLSVDELSERYGVGRRTLERRFKRCTSNTLVSYIQRVKIEAAKRMLEQGLSNVNEVMYDVGYSDPKAFREVFKKYTDMTPMDYRSKFNKDFSLT